MHSSWGYKITRTICFRKINFGDAFWNMYSFPEQLRKLQGGGESRGGRRSWPRKCTFGSNFVCMYVLQRRLLHHLLKALVFCALYYMHQTPREFQTCRSLVFQHWVFPVSWKSQSCKGVGSEETERGNRDYVRETLRIARSGYEARGCVLKVSVAGPSNLLPHVRYSCRERGTAPSSQSWDLTLRLLLLVLEAAS